MVREDKEMCAFGCCKCIQLAEVSFFAAGRLLNASSVSNPGGCSPPSQGPGSVIDGSIDTKWVDMSLPKGFPPGPRGYSALEIEIDPIDDATLLSYSFSTANDATWRDPLAWTVRCWLPGGGSELFDRREGTVWMPETRHASVGPFPLAPRASPPPMTIPLPPPSAPPPPSQNGDLQLVGGDLPSEGLLQVYHDGRWGTVCDDGFSLVDAHVACRQLGWAAGAAELMQYRPDPSGANRAGALTAAADRAVWMDAVACQGTEAKLADCAFGGWGRENCQHAEDVAVRCNATGAPTTTPTAPWTPMPVGVDEGHGAPAAATQSPCQPRGAGGATIDIAPCVACLRGALALLSLPSVALLVVASAVAHRLRTSLVLTPPDTAGVDGVEHRDNSLRALPLGFAEDTVPSTYELGGTRSGTRGQMEAHEHDRHAYGGGDNLFIGHGRVYEKL